MIYLPPFWNKVYSCQFFFLVLKIRNDSNQSFFVTNGANRVLQWSASFSCSRHQIPKLPITKRWTHGDMEFLFVYVQVDIAANEWGDMELNSISPRQPCITLSIIYAPSVIRKGRFNTRFENRSRCQSFMALNGANDVSAAHWRCQTQGKNIAIFILIFQVEPDTVFLNGDLRNPYKAL